jgi:hypothetical protein
MTVVLPRTSATALASAILLLGVAPAASAAGGAAPQAPTAGTDAAAPATAASADGSRLQLGLGVGLIVGLGDAYVGDGSGGIQVESPLPFMQLSLAPSRRVGPNIALGLRASYGFEVGSREIASSSGESLSLDRNLWEIAVTIRYQRIPGRAGYLVLSPGAMALVDSEGNASVSQWAFPAVGFAVGYDVEMARAFALGVEARAT